MAQKVLDDQGMALLRVPQAEYGEKYREHFLEQYRLYVEMADRVSSRRSAANAFFLSAHTVLLGALAFLCKGGILSAKLWMIAPALAILTFCLVWWRTIRSYRQLSAGKFKVIHQMEQRLPAAPYDAEWQALGKGKEPTLYRPLTGVENWVPGVFALLYILLGVTLLVAKPPKQEVPCGHPHHVSERSITDDSEGMQKAD